MTHFHKTIVNSATVFIAATVFTFSLASCAPKNADAKVSTPAVADPETEQQVKMYLSLGFENYKNKQYERALEHFKKVLELDPQNETAFKYIADSYLRHPDTTFVDTALAFYADAISKFPDNPYFQSGRGYVCKKVADNLQKRAESLDSAKATMCLIESDTMMNSAKRHFSRAVAIKGDDVKSSSMLGYIYLASGKLDSSLYWYEYTTKQDPNNTDAWKILAKLYVARSDDAKSAEAFRNLARLMPDEPENILRQGQYLAKIGRFQDAAQILNNYIATHTDDYRGFQYLGLALAADGKFTEALEKFKQAEKLNSSSEKLFCDIAATYIEKKQYAGAQSYLAKARKVNPSYGFTAILEADLEVNQTLDKITDGTVSMELKCELLVASRIYRRALRDPDWGSLAQSKLDRIAPFLPTAEEIASYKFMTGKQCGE